MRLDFQFFYPVLELHPEIIAYIKDTINPCQSGRGN